MKNGTGVLFGWVVTHTEDHDDEESCTRAVTEYAPNASKAWARFLLLVGGTHKTWQKRGYVARRVKITVTIEQRGSHK